MTELSTDSVNLIEKLRGVDDIGKINCRTFQNIWSSLENDKKFISNCFCSLSSRKTFKNMFYQMYDEYQIFKNDKR